MYFNNQNFNDEFNTKLLLMLPMVPKRQHDTIMLNHIPPKAPVDPLALRRHKSTRNRRIIYESSAESRNTQELSNQPPQVIRRSRSSEKLQ